MTRGIHDTAGPEYPTYWVGVRQTQRKRWVVPVVVVASLLVVTALIVAGVIISAAVARQEAAMGPVRVKDAAEGSQSKAEAQRAMAVKEGFPAEFVDNVPSEVAASLRNCQDTATIVYKHRGEETRGIACQMRDTGFQGDFVYTDDTQWISRAAAASTTQPEYVAIDVPGKYSYHYVLPVGGIKTRVVALIDPRHRFYMDFVSTDVNGVAMPSNQLSSFLPLLAWAMRTS